MQKITVRCFFGWVKARSSEAKMYIHKRRCLFTFYKADYCPPCPKRRQGHRNKRMAPQPVQLLILIENLCLIIKRDLYRNRKLLKQKFLESKQ